jgi:phage host-nuclease inhibitor protein Gam
MKKKIEKPQINNTEQFASTCADVLRIQNRLNQIKLHIEEKYREVVEEFDEEIGELDVKLKTLKGAAFEYAEENENELFPEKKTIEFPLATAKFHKGNFKVTFLRKLTAEDVIEGLKMHTVKVKKHDPETDTTINLTVNCNDYVRTVEEVNKEKIIQDRDLLSEIQWKVLGVKIGQDKSLTIENPAGADLENKQSIKQAA